MTSVPTRSGRRAITIDGFGGVLVLPGDDAFDDVRRVDNALIDRRPLAVFRCHDAADVAAVVCAARRDLVDVTVRAAGHGRNGTVVADGAYCIDLREMNGIAVDAPARTVSVGPGATWAELDAATQAHGLAVTGGRLSTSGVAGLVLGSGRGWLERAIGGTGDSLLAADVVTADGRRVRASKREHPGLFWGLRGGGGNFGVVTAFHFSLRPVGPTVVAGTITFPADQAAAVVRHYRDVIEAAPDELCGGILLRTAGASGDDVPDVRLRPVVSVVVCHVGPAADAEAVVGPLRSFGRPVADSVGPMSYVDVQRMFDADHPPGACHYASSDLLAELTDDAVATLSEQATRPVSALSSVLLTPGGGSIGQAARRSTALGDHQGWTVQYRSIWNDVEVSPGNVAHTRSMSAAMAPWATGRVSIDDLGDDPPGRVAAAYGPAQYARLAALKRTWDPDNVFRHTPNIPPA